MTNNLLYIAAVLQLAGQSRGKERIAFLKVANKFIEEDLATMELCKFDPNARAAKVRLDQRIERLEEGE